MYSFKFPLNSTLTFLCVKTYKKDQMSPTESTVLCIFKYFVAQGASWGRHFSCGNAGVIVLGNSSLLEVARLPQMPFMSGTLFIPCHHLGKTQDWLVGELRALAGLLQAGE